MIRLKTMDNSYILINPDYIILAEPNGRDVTVLTVDIIAKDKLLTKISVQISLNDLQSNL